MEEIPENGKESSHSAHDSGMNELDMQCQQHTEFWKHSCFYIKVLCTPYILEWHEQGKTLIILNLKAFQYALCCAVLYMKMFWQRWTLSYLLKDNSTTAILSSG
jgi:hypothetical protein